MKAMLLNAWASGLCIGIAAISFATNTATTGITLLLFLAGLLNGAAAIALASSE